ncbi:MAG: flagellar hook-associated protein FlgK [Phyllobacteriaceae bacterium]|nr:flagellar hook-associated protein FlgK [Phyllobacteriaceae bacterium]
MGLNTTVGIAASGLKVTQAATAQVSANIAGASVDGYTAKSTSTQAIYAETGLVGFTTIVTRAFDQEVFDQLATSTATSSYLDTKNTYLQQVQSLLGSTENGAALPTVLSTFSTDLQTLGAQPDSTAAQIAVVNSATVVAQTLNSLSSSVSDVAATVDSTISSTVDDVNTLTSQIADLNGRIVSVQAQGGDVTGLQDARDKAVLQLSNAVDVEVKPQSNGSVRISTGGGLTLVDGDRATQLALGSDGTVRVASATGTGPDVIATGLVTSGSLAALVAVRDEVLPQVQSQLDQVAAGLASAMSDTTTAGTAATSGTQSGYSVDTSGLSSGNKLTLTYTDATTGESKTVSFVKVESASSLPLSDTATLDPNDTVVGLDFSGGMTSVTAQIQAALGSNFAVSNPSGGTIQILDAGTGAVSVDGLSATVTQTDPQSGNAALGLFTDAGTAYTGSFDGGSQLDGFASRIAVSTAVSADPSLLVDYSTTTQTGDSTRPTALYDTLADGTISTTLGNGLAVKSSTIASYANSMVSYWAGQASTQQTLLDNQSVVQSNLQSRMSDASSVNTDTEMTKLIQLQNYYSANAQVLSTLRDMLDTLVNAI